MYECNACFVLESIYIYIILSIIYFMCIPHVKLIKQQVSKIAMVYYDFKTFKVSKP